MLENYLPSKKIVSLLIFVVIGLGIIMIANNKDGSSSSGKTSVTVVPNNFSDPVKDTDTFLLSDINKTNIMSQTLIPNALMVASARIQTDNGIFVSDDDIDVYISSLSDRLDYKISRYTKKDIAPVSTSKNSIRKYIQTIFDASTKHLHPQTGQELELLEIALRTSDPSSLEVFKDISNGYKNYRNALLEAEVPKVYIDYHVGLLNNYNIVIVSVNDMRKIISDPVASAVAISAYKEAEASNASILYDIGASLSTYIQ